MKVLLALFTLVATPALAAGDAERGAHVYEGCQDCHSLDKNDVGPRHRGVFGRKAGSLADFDYSPALKGAGFVWDEATLDKWLTDPQAFLPGVRMFYHLAEAQEAKLPSVFYGRLDKNDDVDCYKIRLKAGDWLDASLEAARGAQ